jgi:hypothetical protein
MTPQIPERRSLPVPVPGRASSESDPTNTPTLSTVAPTGSSIELLASLRQHSHAAEQALYAQLATTPMGALNDVQRAFMIAAKGTGASSLASLQPVLTLAVLNDKNSSASLFFSAKQLFTASTQ